MSKPGVLLLGATGLFGELLAKRILRDARFNLICAGRNETKLKAFCDAYGGQYQQLDRQDIKAVRSALSRLKPFAVIDCAGPYQAYGDEPYEFAMASIEAGCHYLDIADASAFVKGFSGLDKLANTKNVTALSGCSSTPAISSSVAGLLVRGFEHVQSVTTIIIPGNKAKRTTSVMQSILSQVGQPMEITRYGKNELVKGWSETEGFDLNVDGKNRIRNRLASFVNTPDIAFFAKRYKAKTVSFKAGLELKSFHYALVAGRYLVSSGLIKSLEPFTRVIRWLASWFEWAGSDEGGMKVSVIGQKASGEYERREWDLIADDGTGPNIPTLPVSIMLNKILDGGVKTGARACLGEISLDELDAELAKFDAKTQIHKTEYLPIFKKVVGESFEELPHAVKELHTQIGKHVYEGKAQIKGPNGMLGWIASRLVGFPRQCGEANARVTITSNHKAETWVREFDGKRFFSHLSIDHDGFMQERFGPFSIRLGLEVRDDKLFYPVTRGRLFKIIPFPVFLLPQSIAHEQIDEKGRFVFDVELRFKFGGRIAHYQGWLTEVAG